MPAVVEPYARRTNRLTTHQRQVAFAVGGEAGARLLTAFGMAVSPDTLLRLIRNAPERKSNSGEVRSVRGLAALLGHTNLNIAMIY